MEALGENLMQLYMCARSIRIRVVDSSAYMWDTFYPEAARKAILFPVDDLSCITFPRSSHSCRSSVLGLSDLAVVVPNACATVLQSESQTAERV